MAMSLLMSSVTTNAPASGRAPLAQARQVSRPKTKCAATGIRCTRFAGPTTCGKVGIGRKSQSGKSRIVFCAIGGYLGAVDPSSPAGQLSSLESATSSPEEAIVFRKAANTVRVMCEARLQQATAMAVMGLAAGLAEAGVQGVVAKSGFAITKSASGETLSCAAHMWIEVDGRIVDVGYNTTYIFEDSRRAGLDLSDEQLVRSKVGSRMSPLLEGILSGKRRLSLAVLDSVVNVGPEAWAENDGCTVELSSDAPDDAEGLDEAQSMKRAFEDIISNEEVNQFWLEGMPPEYRRIYADLGGPSFG